MPRKAKLTLKEKREKIQEKTLLSQEEVNSLESKIEKNEENIDFSQLKGFLEEQKIEDAPILKETNLPRRNSKRLEGNFIQNPVLINGLKEDEEDDSFKYNPEKGKSEEPNYIRYEDKNIEKITSIREMEKIRKENPLEIKEIKFNGSAQAKTSEQENTEKYSLVRKMDKEKIRKENPLERKEIKYTPENTNH